MSFIRIMSKYEPQIYAILRVVAGFLFLWHGSQKILGFPDSPRGGIAELSTKSLVAGVIELFGGILIMTGLWTRWAAFISCGLMAFAYWMSHGMNAVLPIQNRGELAMLYCFVFLFFWARGSGIWSIDSFRKKSSP